MSRHKEAKPMQVPLLDLKAQYATIREEVQKVINEVCDAQQFVLGPMVKQLEQEVAAYSRARYGVGVSSGTDALLISLMEAGIGPGDRVITTPYTFFATAGVISRLGAQPVFVDIRPDSYNIDPEQLQSCIQKMSADGNGPKAVIPVHLYGQCADMDPILKTAREHGVCVIEDAAQAIGAQYHDKRAGSMGDMGCFSFFPTKNLGGFGDGGMVVTNDSKTAERLASLRTHGAQPKYYHRLIGGNFRLDALQAAVLLVKLRHLDDWSQSRQENAKYYNELFSKSGLTGEVVLPEVQAGNCHIYNQYILRVPNRDELRNYLTQQGVSTEIYYPLPLHLQECFKDLGYQSGDFPESERASRETLALPIYPELTQAQQEFVVEKIDEGIRNMKEKNC